MRKVLDRAFDERGPVGDRQHLNALGKSHLEFLELLLDRLDYRPRVGSCTNDDHTACDFSLAIEFGDAAPEFGNDLDARNVTDRDRNAACAQLTRYVSELVER